MYKDKEIDFFNSIYSNNTYSYYYNTLTSTNV
jgi:hypothetical protein